MSRLAKIILFTGLVLHGVSAQEKQRTVELNTILMESTFKIEGRNAIGTGFVLGRPYLKEPKKLRYVLVTAAHIFEENIGEHVIVHMRRKLDSSRWERLPRRIRIRANGQPLWTRHPEADVAVMYLPMPEGTIKTLVPTTLLADDETLAKFEFHPGDELHCLGYPLGAESNQAGFPILRSGKIASYPLLPTKETKTFLFDFRVFRGNSGGPVFLVHSGRTYGGAMHIGTIQLIIGLVSKEKIWTEEIPELYGSRQQIHTLGLGEVVHASLIKEALELLPAPDDLPNRD